MLQPSPQSRSRYPNERRGLGEKKEKKEGKKKMKKSKNQQRRKTGAILVKALGKTRSYS